ncbi:MAG: lysoplasmalogenase [Microthrixaceae bacterium]|nr:lysoplasmalogenase [Microthrixaceae bacterium]
MTPTATFLLATTVVVAVWDWVAVGLARRGVEYVFKPLTMVVLIGTAVVLEPRSASTRSWFVVALVFSLFGDVFLMLADQKRWFVPGLVSFLVGHLAYMAGLVVEGLDGVAVGVGAGLMIVAATTIAPRLLRGVRGTDERLVAPVIVYVSAISAMVVCAVGSTNAMGAVGALLFYLSDLTIGWTRFVKAIPASRLVIIVTYHVAQLLLVGSLVVSS